MLRAAALLAASGCVGDPPPPELTPAQQAALERYVVAAPPAGMIAGSVDFDGRGAMVGNLDSAGPLRAMDRVVGPPLPPSRWRRGQVYLDPLRFPIPAGVTGELRVMVGLFRGRDRLAVRGGPDDGALQATALRLRVAPARSSHPPEAVAPAPVPELEVRAQAKGTLIVIDGVLDEPAWQSAAPTGPFVHPGTGRYSAGQPLGGSARLTRDQQHLYVAIEAEDATVHGGWPADAVDPHLWEKDTVEIMIDPDGDGDGDDYYEIQLSPQGLVFDSQFDHYNQPRGGPSGPFGHEEWSAQVERAVKVHGTIDDDSDRDRGYTVEARVPWRALHKARRSPPAPGDRWRMNFYVMQDNGGVSWSPILGQGNFHRASRFGRVVWGAAR
ncbi:MAG: carbohydrate-binding family 9-like protein [Deltaproteobacteria bacterium]|nr:carbohydrate-binding family 9-like protein [Deltaproteobacteria bacterium]